MVRTYCCLLLVLALGLAPVAAVAQPPVHDHPVASILGRVGAMAATAAVLIPFALVAPEVMLAAIPIGLMLEVAAFVLGPDLGCMVADQFERPVERATGSGSGAGVGRGHGVSLLSVNANG